MKTMNEFKITIFGRNVKYNVPESNYSDSLYREDKEDVSHLMNLH